MIGALGESDPRDVGGYRMLAELGRGGMGRVLLGAGPDGRLVAVKLVRAQLVEDEDFRSRFKREVAASRKVSGAYTAAVIDADANAATPWLASVFVPGPSLSDVVAGAGPLPEDAATRLAAGLAAALVDVHGAALVHRDLKPSNVLLAADGPRVIDFGIARAADSEGGSEITHTGWLIGSPGFMSPEQAEGRPLTAASDVFSLGCVVFFACAGKGPFVGSSTPQTLYNVVHTEPDLTAVPDGLREIVERCLAKAPEDRPAPAELRDELAGRIAPAAQPWPAAVHALIDRQQAEVAALLGPREDETVAIRQDPATVIVTRPMWGPPPVPVPPPTNRLAAMRAAIAGLVVVICLAIVWAVWTEYGPDDSASSSTYTTEPDPYPTEEEPTYTTDDTTTAETTTEEPANGAYSAVTGDCLSGSENDLVIDSCVPGNYEVLARVDGTSDETGACTGVDPTWTVSWEATADNDALVLCLEYLYTNPVFNAGPGECAWAEDQDSDWAIVPCDDYVFEVLSVLHGPTTQEDCGDDVRLRMTIHTVETDSDLSARACMTFRYGNDGGFARTDDCLVLVGSGDETDPTFTDCANATHYVSGYNSDTFDPAFCGADAWHGWEDDGPWAEYLNYTICLRAT